MDVNVSFFYFAILFLIVSGCVVAVLLESKVINTKSEIEGHAMKIPPTPFSDCSLHD